MLHPTINEFQDFKAYVASAADVGWNRGCVNIVPPPEWKVALCLVLSPHNSACQCCFHALATSQARASYRNVSFDIVNPVRQHAFGDRGQYKVIIMR